MTAERRGDDEVLAPVPEEERFRRLEELQEEHRTGSEGAPAEPAETAAGEIVSEEED